MRIATLHADDAQTALICQVMESAGHQCLSGKHSEDLLVQLRREPCDLLLLDWDVATPDSATLLQWARAHLPATLPVLILTSCSNEEVIVAALEAGANDYLVKPLRKGELATRTQTLLRRAYPGHDMSEQIRVGPYVFETNTGRLSMAGKRIDLTQKEFDLALLFFRNLGRPLSRTTILESVWEHDLEGSSRTMDTHVSRIRSKLRLRPETGFRLAPVYSYGYRLEQLAAGGAGQS